MHSRLFRWGSRLLLVGAAVAALAGALWVWALGWLGWGGADLTWARRIEEENRTGHSFGESVLVQGGQALLLVDTNSRAPGEQRAWLLWLDGAGRVLRERFYGTSPGAAGRVLVPAPAGGVFVVGERSVAPRTFQGWVLRLDAAGEVLWERALGRPGVSGFVTGHVLPDGSIVVAGGQSFRGYVALLGSDGAVRWERELPEQHQMKAMAPLGEDAVALGCQSELRTTGPGRSAVVALGLDGALRWTADLAAHGRIDLRAITRLPGGDLLAAGPRAREGGSDNMAWLARLRAANGELVWQKSFGEPGESTDVAALTAAAAAADERARSATAHLLLRTVRMQKGLERHRIVLALDADGQVLWQQRWGGSDSDQASALTAGPDRSVLVVGSLQGRGPGKTQAALWRLSPEGRVLGEQIFGLP